MSTNTTRRNLAALYFVVMFFGFLGLYLTVIWLNNSSFENVNIILGAIFFIVFIVLFIGLFMILKQFVSKPLEHISKITTSMKNGVYHTNLDQLSANSQAGSINADLLHCLSKQQGNASILKEFSEGNFMNLEMPENNNDLLVTNISVLRNTMVDFYHCFDTLASDILHGKLNSRVDEDAYSGDFRVLASKVNKIIDTVVKQMDDLEQPILSVDKEFNILYANKLVEQITNKTSKQLIGKKCYDQFNTGHCKTEKCATYQAMKQARKVSASTTADTVTGKYDISYTGRALKNENGKVVGAYESIVDQTEVIGHQRRLEKQAAYQERNVQQLLENIEHLSEGSFDMNFVDFEYDEDTRDLHEVYSIINSNLNKSVQLINHYIVDITKLLERMANSDLDLEVDKEYIGDFKSIKSAFEMIISSLNGVIKDIYTSSEAVSTSAIQMNDGAQSLSSGVTEQAASIEEISATVTQVAAQVKENAKHAEAVKASAIDSVEKAQESNEIMTHLTESMKEVQKATTNIQKVLKMINDIAFQTNILSLNAAVEAARAGQHGKGFAVIAEDVRNLALKSANAADETTEMLDSIVTQINDSVSYATQTNDSLHKIMESANESLKLSNEVAEASVEQSTAIEQITLSLDQISQVVQTTSVNAQQSAQSSEGLSGQADNLMEIVSGFKVKDFNSTFERKVRAKIEKEYVIENDNPIINLGDQLEF
jgi:methyl-accepting chemotaxis protein